MCIYQMEDEEGVAFRFALIHDIMMMITCASSSNCEQHHKRGSEHFDPIVGKTHMPTLSTNPT